MTTFKPTLVVHGGAGPRGTPEVQAERTKGCERAAAKGWAILRAGGSALEAAIAAVVVLEDDPSFNAGTGSSLNADGEVEMDASVMDGHSLGAGAVAAVRRVKNPVLLAKEVMQRTPHVLLASEGAERFALKAGFSLVDPSALIVPRARKQYEDRLAEETKGTVGAVALDEQGHVAAATSTGGTRHKLPGRIGDSPLIGAGTYADDRSGAASATGDGEACIKAAVCKRATDLLTEGALPAVAAQRALSDVKRMGGTAGLIVLDRHTNLFAAEFTTEWMAWAVAY